jgi:hypothetical protein
VTASGVIAGRSTEAIAASVGTSPALIAELLRSEEQRGHVERVAGGWRLTAKAARLYGPAFRALERDRGAMR